MAKKAAATPVVDEEDEDVATEEEADTESKADEVWGVQNLRALIKEKTGKDYKPREIRTLLRKMAREDGTIDREIVAGNKARYSWSGPDDPEVKAVLKQVKGGAIETAKKAALDKLKSDKAKKDAAKKKAAPAKGKEAPAADDDEDEE